MKLSEKIELYIDGELDEEEKQNIEKQINENPELEREIHVRQELNQLIKEALTFPSMPEDPGQELNQAQKLEINDDFFRFYERYDMDTQTEEENLLRLIRGTGMPQKKRRISLSFLFTVAASVSLLVIIGAGIAYINRKVSLQNQLSDLYQQNFQPGKDPALQSILYESGFSSLMEAEGEFTVNRTMSINQILRDSDYDDYSLLYLSLTKMKEEKFEEAGLILKFLIQSKNSELSDAALWYYALVQIKEGKKNAARKLLQPLCSKNSGYKQGACSVIESLSDK